LKQRKTALLQLLDDTYSLKNQPEILRFLDRYIDCESTARKIVKFYKKDRYHKTLEQEHINVREVASAAKHFGFPMAAGDVYALFRGGRGIRGEKTPRQLRNAYVHAKKESDALEILEDIDAHNALMQRWLRSVKGYIETKEEALA